MPTPRRVLFVCMGNICRSPAGEGIFRAYIGNQGAADRYAVDSAGTTGYHAGEPPDARMTRAAAARGYDLSTQTARQFVREDLERFDLVVAMDRDNLGGIIAKDPDGKHRAKVALLMDFHPDPRGHRDVPDPYYGGPNGFDHVLDLIEAACPAIFARLENEAPRP